MSNRNSFIESTKETDERLEALKQLYPEIFSDGKINLDAFKDVTGTSDLPEGQDKTPGYYGLYWPGKRAAKQLARKEAEGTLEPVLGDGVNEDTTHNIYIEGDNLEVLRILKQSYKGRVKMIYIDPPYNTGKDFIYPDNFKMPVDEYLKLTGQIDEQGRVLVSNTKSNGAYHSKWLSMMLPRLQIAKEILNETGVIFISIDEAEQANLKLLCDDVFGEENYITTFTRKGSGGRQDSTFYAVVHEYIICYAKDINLFVSGKMIKDDDVYPFYDEDKKLHYKTQLLRKWGENSRRIDRPNLYYPIKDPDGNDFYPMASDTVEGCWRWGKETMENNIKDGFVEFKQKDGKWNAYEKIFEPTEGNEKTKLYSTVIDDVSNSTGASLLKELFNGKVFDYPKPVELIDRVIKLSNVQNGDIILDFFSGSSTTAHAVMEYNRINDIRSKYVMVQLPISTERNDDAISFGFNTICDIAKERIRRAGVKILEEIKANKDMFSEDNPLDVGFKVYRMTTSNFKKYAPVSGQDKEAENSLFKELEENLVPLVEGWKSENVLTEIILKQGFALDCTKEKLDSFKKNTVYKITDSSDSVCKKITLYVCLDPSIEKETIDILKLNDDEKFICLDAAIDDSAYARLADKGRIETI